MNRRWQVDGIPFWRKLFSSNWWWYGEVNPDPDSLPSLENRPKFWRGEVIFIFCVCIGIPTLTIIPAELNSRYFPFNQTTSYVGRILESRHTYPQLTVELQDKTVVNMAFPMQDMLGLPSRGRSIHRWTTLIDGLQNRQYDCSDQLLAFDAELWKFTFRPFLNVWEVRCATGGVLIPSSEIVGIWTEHTIWSASFLYGLVLVTLTFSVFLIIRRERKRYVKS